MEIFNESRYEPESDSEVYLTSKRKENFFKVISKTSRSSAPRRKLFINAASVINNFNIVLFHTHGTEAFEESYETNYRSLDENLNIYLSINKHEFVAVCLYSMDSKTLHTISAKF